MQNYSVIEDLDHLFISQSKWKMLLQKQLVRNHQFFKGLSKDSKFQISKIFHKQTLPIMLENISKSVEQTIVKQEKRQQLEKQKKQKNRKNSLSAYIRQSAPKSNLKSEKKLSPNKSLNSNFFIRELNSIKRYQRQTTGDQIKQEEIQNQYVGSTVLINKKYGQFQKQLELIESIQKSKQNKRKLLSLHEVGIKLKSQHLDSDHLLAKKINHIEKLIMKSAIVTPPSLVQGSHIIISKSNVYETCQFPSIKKKMSRIDILKQVTRMSDQMTQAKASKMNKIQNAKTRESETDNQTENDRSFEDNFYQKNYVYKDFIKKQAVQRKQFEKAMYRITKIHPIKFPMFM